MRDIFFYFIPTTEQNRNTYSNQLDTKLIRETRLPVALSYLDVS